MRTTLAMTCEARKNDDGSRDGPTAERTAPRLPASPCQAAPRDGQPRPRYKLAAGTPAPLLNRTVRGLRTWFQDLRETEPSTPRRPPTASRFGACGGRASMTVGCRAHTAREETKPEDGELPLAATPGRAATGNGAPTNASSLENDYPDLVQAPEAGDHDSEDPDDAQRAERRQTGFELQRVQQGLDPSDWKPMRSVGAGVREIRIQVGTATGCSTSPGSPRRCTS